MRVFAVIPVHNRYRETCALLDCLRRQTWPSLSVIVSDDGSTDETTQLSTAWPDIVLLRGNGHLWWAGAAQLGIDYALRQASASDYVLLLNNDTSFAADYVERLIAASAEYGGAVVGTALRDVRPPHELLDLGPSIDYWRMECRGLLESLSAIDAECLPDAIATGAISGRGVLYPVQVLRRIGSLRSSLLPHYWADYELSARAHRAGVPTVVSTRTVTYSERSFGGEPAKVGVRQRLLGRRSRNNLVDAFVFFLLSGTWLQRLSAPPRFAYFFLLKPVLRRFANTFRMHSTSA